MNEPLMMTRNEVAESLRVGVKMVDLLIKNGEIQASKIGTRTLIKREHVVEFVNSLPRNISLK